MKKKSITSKFSRNIPHPFLITVLCIKGGVTFSEVEEETCPNASPLSLIGALKALVENEEEERRRKKKRTVEQLRGLVPTVVAEEEMSGKEMGAFKPT